MSIKANGSGTSKVGTSDASGFYKISLPESDSISVCFSYEGFKTQNFVFSGRREQITKNVTLEEDAIALQEVVVKGNNVIHGNEKTIYFPTRNQIKGTNTGFGLLYNMMIPELRVDKRNGFVTTSYNTNVTQCINGVPASMTELKSIRPKDVIRIDFYPIPTGKFARYEAVIDYVVRNNNKGGYVDIKTSTTILNAAGDYNATLKYNHNSWINNFIGGFDFAENKKSKSIVDEWIGLTPEFRKQSLTDKFKKDEYRQNLHWGLTKTTDKLQISLKTDILGNSTPHSDSENSLNYTPDVYSSLSSTVRSDTKSFGTYFNGELQWNINKRQYLIFDASYQYGHSRFNRSLTESAYSSSLSTTENSHSFYTGVIYSLSTERNRNLTFQLYEIGDIYKDRYRGDINERQSLDNNYIKADILYKYPFSKRLYAQANLSVEYVLSKVNETKENTWLFQPSFYVSYKTGSNGRLILNAKTGYVSPPIEWKSDIYQNVNAYEQIKGNKDLHHFLVYLPSVSYSYSFSDIKMNATVSSYLSRHSVQDAYYQENNKLIHTFIQGGHLRYFAFDYKLTSYLFNNSLQLSGGIGYDVTKTNNEFKDAWKCFRYSFDFMYSIGDFSFSGNYSSKRKGFELTGSTYSRIPYFYSFSSAYSKGHWYAAIDLNNIFGCQHYGEEYINSSLYKRTCRQRSPEFYSSITFSLSYNFDFGHKKVERDDEVIDKSISTGFLRPKE